MTEIGASEAPSLAEELGHRIEAVCDLLGARKNAARIAEVSTDQLGRYIKGTSQPGLPAVARICRHAKVSLDWLWSGEGGMMLADRCAPSADHISRIDGVWEEFDLVPLYDAVVSAGAGSVVTGDERPLAQMAFRKYWLGKLGLRAADLVMIRARGDSMEPAIRDGDTLLLDTSRNTPEGGYIYVVRVNDELRAKRLQRLMDGSVRVSSDNKVYADEVIDVSDLEHLHILGRVVWKGGLI